MATHLPETRVPAQPIVSAPVEAPAGERDERVDQAARAIGPLVRALGARRDFAIRFWDGRGLPVIEGEPAFTVVIRRPAALRRMLLPPTDLAIGEAYVHGDFDIEGDIFAAASLPDRFADVQLAPLDWARMTSRLAGLRDRSAPREGREPVSLSGERHSVTRDRDAVRFHYDVGNDFYRLWLDERMVYSCAYFRKRRATLDEAQLAKLDLVLDKIQLRDGMRLLDIGCGWGGLLMRAAERFDVEAVGITLSERQFELARDRIAERGLAERCRVDLLDYRDAAATLGTFDRISSVGMAEHVGRSRIRDYFAAAASTLRPGGLFLNHAIAAQPVRMQPPGMVFGGPLRQIVRERSFVDAYVFPDGELLPLSVSLEAAEAAGFTVRDVESLRPHYALTLRHWVARLDAHWDQAVAAAGETTARTWRLFMAGAAVGFESSRLDVHQALLALPRADGTNDAPPIRTWR